MKKAAAVPFLLLILAQASAQMAGPLPEGATDHRGTFPSLFAQAGGLAETGFTLAGRSRTATHPELQSLDMLPPAELTVAGTPPEMPAAGLKNDPAVSRLSVSFFFGSRGDDVFASLHKAYAWKPMSRSLTVGLGLYREIPLYRGIGLLPYVGIIRASATLSLAGRNGNRESIEYRVTAFCVGLPLVVRFN